MKSPTLRAWLARQPYPSTVRAEKLDGDEKTVRIGVSRSKFRDAEAALKDCVRCEALDESGATLRVWEADNIEEQRAEVDENAPTGEQTMLTEFAKLLTQACDQAVQRHETMVKTAFEQMGALVNTLSARNAALEKAWHGLLMSQQPAAENSDPNAALMNALLPALLTGGLSGPPPQPPANGKG